MCDKLWDWAFGDDNSRLNDATTIIKHQVSCQHDRPRSQAKPLCALKHGAGEESGQGEACHSHMASEVSLVLAGALPFSVTVTLTVLSINQQLPLGRCYM